MKIEKTYNFNLQSCMIITAFFLFTSCKVNYEKKIRQNADSSIKEKHEISLSANSSKIDSVFNFYFVFFDSVFVGHYDNSYPVLRIREGSDFMYKITGIPSVASVSFIGQLSITQKDYENWKNWYHQNKHRLRWDTQKKTIVLVDSVK